MVLLRCVNAKEAESMMGEVHEGSFGMHANRHAMARKILRVGYYWLTMESVATYPSAGGRRETRGMRLPKKEYARSRHQRLYEENVGKTGKDVVYEL